MSKLPEGLFFDLVRPDEVPVAHELEAAGERFEVPESFILNLPTSLTRIPRG